MYKKLVKEYETGLKIYQIESDVDTLEYWFSGPADPYITKRFNEAEGLFEYSWDGNKIYPRSTSSGPANPVKKKDPYRFVPFAIGGLILAVLVIYFF